MRNFISVLIGTQTLIGYLTAQVPKNNRLEDSALVEPALSQNLPPLDSALVLPAKIKSRQTEWVRDAFYFLGRHDSSMVAYNFELTRTRSTNPDSGVGEFKGMMHWKNHWFNLEQGRFPFSEWQSDKFPLHPAWDFTWPRSQEKGEFFYHYQDLSLSLVFNPLQPLKTLVFEPQEKSQLYITNATLQGQKNIIAGVLLVHRQKIENWVEYSKDSTQSLKPKRKVHPLKISNEDEFDLKKNKRKWVNSSPKDSVKKELKPEKSNSKLALDSAKSPPVFLQKSDSTKKQVFGKNLNQEKQEEEFDQGAQWTEVPSNSLPNKVSPVTNNHELQTNPIRLFFLNALGGQNYFFWTDSLWPGKTPFPYAIKLAKDGSIHHSNTDIKIKTLVSDTTYNPPLELAWLLESDYPALQIRLNLVSASPRTKRERYILVEGKGVSGEQTQRIMGLMVDLRSLYETSVASKALDKDLKSDFKVKKHEIVPVPKFKPEVSKELPWKQKDQELEIPETLEE